MPVTREEVDKLILRRNNFIMMTPYPLWDLEYDDALEEAFYQKLEQRIGSYGVEALLETLHEYHLNIKL